MTKIKAVAGPEMDAVVAEHIMGYKMMRVNSRVQELRLGIDVVVRYERGRPPIYIGYQRPNLPAYSTDIACAWQIVEAFRKKYRRVEVHAVCDQEGGGYACLIEDGTSAVDESYIADAEAETTPLAICVAALRAKGIEIEP